jgi:hypothetical protein
MSDALAEALKVLQDAIQTASDAAQDVADIIAANTPDPAPLPVDPAPVDPAPAPVDPAPVDPAPAPVDPAPLNPPAPDPVPPVDPAPVNPAPAPVGSLTRPVYQFSGDPTSVDSAVWPNSGRVAVDGSTLYFYSGDVQNGDGSWIEKGSYFAGWTLYTGATSEVAIPSDQ